MVYELLGVGSLSRLHALHAVGLQEYVVQLLSAEALAPNIEDRSIVKDAVKGAQEGIVLVECFSPAARALVAGKDNVVIALLVVPSVNKIEEEPGVLLVELAMANLVNNEAGRTDETGKRS